MRRLVAMRMGVGAGLLALAAGVADAQVAYGPGQRNTYPSWESVSGTNVVALQVRLSVPGTEAAVIQSLTVSAAGALDDVNDISAVHLYRDVDGDGWFTSGTDQAILSNQTFASNNGSITFSSLTETIPAGNTEYWMVLLDFAGTGSMNDDVTLSMAASGAVVASGAVSGSALTVTGTAFSGGKIRVCLNCTLTIYDFRVHRPTGALESQTAYEMAGFEMRASTGATISLSGITLHASGTGHDKNDVTQVRLFRDTNRNSHIDSSDVEIGGTGVTFDVDDGTASFTGLAESIAAGTRVFYIVAYDFGSMLSNWATYSVAITQGSDLTNAGTHSGHTGPCDEYGLPTCGTPAVQPYTAHPTDPYPTPRKAVPNQYCCSTAAPIGDGGLGEGLAALLAGWWPLMLLAFVVARARRPRLAFRRER